MSTTAVTRGAAVLVGLEGVGLAALVPGQLASTFAGDVESVVSGVALAVMTLVAAVGVVAFAAAIWRGLSWGRSGGIVTQLLILAVAFGAATGVYANALTGALLAVPALVCLVLLILVVRDAGRAIQRDGRPD
jgi:hypothetical protein